MKNMKSQVNEIFENQDHILKAIKMLNERLNDVETKTNAEESNGDVRNILETQEMIDKIIVKNVDDIQLMKRNKDDNHAAIKLIEAKMEYFDSPITEIVKKKEQIETDKGDKKVCRYYNRGFCRKLNNCEFSHPETVCEIFNENKTCRIQNCNPKPCRYWGRG